MNPKLLFGSLSVALALAAVPLTARTLSPGTRFRDAGFAPDMIVIPPGKAMLGSTEAETTREGRTPAFAAFEHPQHEAVIDRAFAVSRFHVAKREFDAFVRATKRDMAGCVVAVGGAWSNSPVATRSYRDVGFAQADDHPAVCVNWDDADAYAAWLSAKTGHRYRLLSETEWEYAARGGTATARWWGDEAASICKRANGGDQRYAAIMPADKSANLACSDGFATTSPGKTFAANPFGLHDMLGNAWQWTADCFAPAPNTAAPDGPCKGRSIRGGSWHNSVSTLRAAARFSLPPTMRSSSLGFRVMRELP